MNQDYQIGATKHLAARTLGIRYESLDETTIAHAKRLFLDHIGCVLVGSILPWTKIVFRFVSDFGGNPDARIVNYGHRCTTHDAAYVNAIFSQGHEWDDFATRKMGAGHPGAGTWPVALAIGEKLRSSGKELLAASVAGYECMSRVGKALGTSSDRRGHHRQGLVSPLGAATVASHMLQSTEHEAVMALSIAASHSSGLNEFGKTGGEVKRLHAGNGVRAGIQAAILARSGYTGPPSILEGEQGFVQAYSSEPAYTELTCPSDTYEIMESGIKMNPCVATSQTPIECLELLMKRAGFTHTEIENIHVSVSIRAIEHGGAIYRPTDVSSAQFSIPFGIGLRAVLGSNDLSHYTNEALWGDERIADIGRRIKFEPDDDAVSDLRHSCRMVVTLKNGAKHEVYKAYPRGSFLDPITTDEAQKKFALMAGRVVGDKRVEQIIAAVEGIEGLHDVTDLVDLLCVRNP